MSDTSEPESPSEDAAAGQESGEDEEYQPIHFTEAEYDEFTSLNEKAENELTDQEVTSKIKYSVKRRFDPPTWALVFEYQYERNGRRADCLALNTSASRNFKLVGFEFKASRSDWLSEKRDSEKADTFVELCDEWYVVAGRRGIVEESELPDGWGLFELKPSGQLWKLVESDLNALQDAEPDRRFFAKFLRKALGGDSNFGYSDIKEARRRGYDEGVNEEIEHKIGREKRKLREKAESFDKIADSDLHLYPPIDDERIAQLETAEQIVKAVAADDFSSIRGRIDSLESQLERAQERVNEETDILREQLNELESEVTGVGTDTNTETDE
ncbi:hypothetical protein [Halosimplex pelagicum]|uniref:Uncharacterized protein n=1 Tax=Halosimplex pelagicum TaxID=869886 RepID=A0A7D5T9W6_9EURY|nr:hypothetical protein [Halosimplex pelagicum]QLH82270.1 hypothetical protein HZS54_11895 [Halosimplex pelagicum]